jgi:hypothetical protein
MKSRSTRRLCVRLAFPTGLQPMVWGIETSSTIGQIPLRTALQSTETNGTTVFDRATGHPPLNARYRFEWKFRAPRLDGH